MIDPRASTLAAAVNLDDRIVLKVYGQHVDGHECVICLANDYEGELVHKRGCDEVFHYVKGVRNGVGLQLPSRREITRVIEHRPGEGPNSAGLGYEGQGFGS